MTKQEMKKQLINKLNELLSRTHEIILTQKSVPLSNELEDAVTIKNRKCGNSTTISIDYQFKQSKNKSIDNIAIEIATYILSDPQQWWSYDDLICDFNEIQDGIFAVLINSDMNRDYLLCNVPHFDVCDLSVIYHVQFCYINTTIDIIITDSIFEQWNISAETLHLTAMNNTKKYKPAIIQPLNYIVNYLLQVYDFNDQANDMFVISNKDLYYGAIGVLETDLLHHVSYLLMSKQILILPSSVHEVVVCRFDDVKIEEAKQLVIETNLAFVDDQEVLSNNLYLFNRDTNQITKL